MQMFWRAVTAGVPADFVDKIEESRTPVLAGWQAKLHCNPFEPLHWLPVHEIGLVFPLLHGLGRRFRKDWIARYDVNTADCAIS